MESSNNPIAAFVKGFFVFLERQGIAACVLHGWRQGFEDALSDVDFVVEPSALAGIVAVVHRYCEMSDWRLCQVFRHETTATYCVCCAKRDPGVVLALDACSDYQQDRARLIPAVTLLAQRVALPWGGFRLSDQGELRYRLAKAAIKSKDAAWAAAEFAAYPDDVRADCAAWLVREWGISLAGWNATDLGVALPALRRKANGGRPFWDPGPVRRMADRAFHPTGMIIVTGRAIPNALADGLASRLGTLYFRRIAMARRMGPGLIGALIQSTAVIVSDGGGIVSRMLPSDCEFVLDPTWDLATCRARIAGALQVRCAKREGLSITP